MYVVCVGFFFFKQKTAYEMRISDWSSDVCSSDLAAKDRQLSRGHRRAEGGARELRRRPPAVADRPARNLQPDAREPRRSGDARRHTRPPGGRDAPRRADYRARRREPRQSPELRARVTGAEPADGDRKSTRLNSSH